MNNYRYVTPARSGKWYPTVEAAQRAADKIGAGFWNEASRQFYQYPQTRLEARTPEQNLIPGTDVGHYAPCTIGNG